MSSIEIIRKTRGGNWPTSELTFEDDFIDLCWHQREFEYKSSFAYTITSLEHSECLGCLYFYPLGFRTEQSQTADVDFSFWVTQKAYDQGLYEVVYQEFLAWIKNEWPFKNVYCSNTLVPGK